MTVEQDTVCEFPRRNKYSGNGAWNDDDYYTLISLEQKFADIHIAHFIGMQTLQLDGFTAEVIRARSVEDALAGETSTDGDVYYRERYAAIDKWQPAYSLVASRATRRAYRQDHGDAVTEFSTFSGYNFVARHSFSEAIDPGCHPSLAAVGKDLLTVFDPAKHGLTNADALKATAPLEVVDDDSLQILRDLYNHAAWPQGVPRQRIFEPGAAERFLTDGQIAVRDDTEKLRSPKLLISNRREQGEEYLETWMYLNYDISFMRQRFHYTEDHAMQRSYAVEAQNFLDSIQ